MKKNCVPYSLEWSPIMRLLLAKMFWGSMKAFMAFIVPSPMSPTVFFSHCLRILPTAQHGHHIWLHLSHWLTSLGTTTSFAYRSLQILFIQYLVMRLSACVCTVSVIMHVYTPVPMYVYVSICMGLQVYMLFCKNMWNMSVCGYTCVYVYMCVCVCVCVCVCACICECACVCVCVMYWHIFHSVYCTGKYVILRTALWGHNPYWNTW